MRILVDADACPAPIKEIVFRAAQRTATLAIFVANHAIRTPPSPHVRAVVVPKGFDVADARIVELVEVGDLVVTADIPLAAAAIEKGARALNPRGELYTAHNVREFLSLRNFMADLRSAGVETSGPDALSNSDRQSFANQLDRLLNAAA